MGTEPSDAAAITRSLDQPDAFRLIFERHFDAILRYCRRRAGRDGDDVASEVFTRAFDLRRRYDVAYEDARPWLYGIATNLLRRARRSEVRRLRAHARIGAEPDVWRDPDPSSRLDAATDGPRIAAALAALRHGDRDALLLQAWGGLGYDEIATALGIPVGTVRSRLNRARNQVRAHLDEGDATGHNDEGGAQWTTSS